jgi:hypothetical protein
MKNNLLICLMAILFQQSIAFGQLPMELFIGDKKTSLDILFFKNFKKNGSQNSRFLFFNRNRISISYPLKNAQNLPQFGSTNAISFNHTKLNGLAPVFVVQGLNTGIFGKIGIQFVKLNPHILLFSWIVVELKANPNLDIYGLYRYTPIIKENIQLFTQIESINTFNSNKNLAQMFIQRARIGVQKKQTQVGVGIDLSEIGRSNYTTISNVGFFVRYDFN